MVKSQDADQTEFEVKDMIEIILDTERSSDGLKKDNLIAD